MFISIQTFNAKITCSTKRSEEFKSYFDDEQYAAMLKHSPTRWLSMTPCITRLLKNFNPLKAYFTDHPESVKKGNIRTIRKILEDEKTKPLLLFLQDVLPSIDRYNKVFQVST